MRLFSKRLQVISCPEFRVFFFLIEQNRNQNQINQKSPPEVMKAYEDIKIKLADKRNLY